MKIKTVDAARGRWAGILAHFGMDRAFLRNVHGPCPTCGGTDRFRFDDKDGNGGSFCNQCGARSGMQLLIDWKGWDFAEAAAEVDKVVNNVEAVPPKPEIDPRPAIEALTAQIHRPSEAVRSYLAGRGLTPSRGIYQAKRGYYKDRELFVTYDCMVAPIVDVNDRLVSYHVTYLQGGQKAPVESPRKVMKPIGTVNGCAIRLTQVYAHIGVAEGIETALAVMMLYKVPCWALVSAGMMERWEVPAGIEAVTIYGDNDSSYTGQAAAYALAKRLKAQGLAVDVQLAPEIDTDFADMIEQRKAA